ncbi:hypothetical protein EWU23_01915 [Cytophagaceae bacterium 50C-KIRBA]|uniref:Uncharacterized protein n=1 Tax=Aquirufa beregesia TaxID=2516556 RepID=A0ABX0ES64_9BACT|nr:hypothetical protein [Aquirufa beregesia]NGZ43224.1 hypothetical protein [Aquirufa beregesia]
MTNFNLFYESANNVPAPYHFESLIRFIGFGTPEASLEVEIQYTDREDFSKEELIAEGLPTDESWIWKGSISSAWQQRLAARFDTYKSGSCKPRDEEPFIMLEYPNSTTKVPRMLEIEENLIQEFIQSIFETAGRELPLFLGFQFKNELDEWVRIEGELSFENLNFTYQESGSVLKTISDWDRLQALMNTVYIADFQADKAKEELKSIHSFAVYPGDGLWYVAGDSLRKPAGNNRYFDGLENSLREIFKS